jgi:hypothetical protein
MLRAFILNSSLNQNLRRFTSACQKSQSPDLLIRKIKPNLIVWDIDGTICLNKEHVDLSKISIGLRVGDENASFELEKHLKYLESQTSAPIFGLTYNFFPHFDLLLKYLLAQNARIVFYSAGTQIRNTALINDMFLKNTFDSKTLDILLTKDQFKIYSRGDLVSGKKDLKPLLKSNENICDAVLMEDDLDFSVWGQAFLFKPPIDFKNYGYYFLGVFLTYFNHPNCENMTLYEFTVKNEWYREDRSYYGRDDKTPLMPYFMEMIKIGLNEVRKTVPEAIFYDTSIPSWYH